MPYFLPENKTFGKQQPSPCPQPDFLWATPWDPPQAPGGPLEREEGLQSCLSRGSNRRGDLCVHPGSAPAHI